MSFCRSAGAAAAVCLASLAAGQPVPIPDTGFPVNVDSGWRIPSGNVGTEILFAEVVTVPGASWLRLRFGDVVLPGSGLGPSGAFLRITSWQDGAQQTLHAEHLAQWRNTSAYFNGDAVLVELVAPAGAAPSRVQVIEAIAGEPSVLGARSICDSTDDRQLSTDARVGRLLPIGCTAWLFNDADHGFLSAGRFLSAGHCAATASAAQVVEFNVPLSTSDGAIQHPPPEDQYFVDVVSLQVASGTITIGNDWAYFGVFPNPVTSMTPYQAQQDRFVLNHAPVSAMGQTLRVTGHGISSSLSAPAWNQVQTTHSGPISSVSGTNIRYRVDMTGGNSGSPIVDEATGRAIGIVTHHGCGENGHNANQGTALWHADLQRALNNPQGVCLGFVGNRFELHRLIHADPQNGDHFGAAVGLWQNTAVVGAPLRASAGAAAGAAYVFEWNEADDEWSGDELPMPATLGVGKQFGFDVAIDAGAIAVSAPGDAVASTAPQVGRVHIYQQEGQGWTLAQTVSPSETAIDDWYGHAVALNGEWLAVGAPRDGAGRGAVYLYRSVGGAWLPFDVLRGPDAEARQFGYGVSLDGTNLLVGARNEMVGAVRAGGAYVYQFDGAAWTERAHLQPPVATTGDQFGAAVRVRNDMAAVGAPFADDAALLSGTIHLYRFDGSDWAAEALLTAGDAVVGDANAAAVTIADGMVISGSPGNDDRGTSSGTLYRFRTEEGGAWDDGLPASVASDTFGGDQLGTALDATDRFIIAGARLHPGGGAAYIFPLRHCPADRDADGDADIFDLLEFLDAWFAVDADVNCDLLNDVFDLLAYLEVWFEGCG